jgi:Ser/Thr protein kinase RdoA (MazF antagonist)
MHRLLDSPRARAIPAPKVLADGDLFDDDGTGWHWPYLIFERIPGVAIRELPANDDFAAIAEHLGEIAAAVHLLTPPADVRARDLLPRLRADAARRCEGFGLPAHLAAQVPAYLADALPPDTLVHADITEDHLFVANGAISGVIDWGDAIVADPFYELPAVYLGALRGERPLLSAFLHGSGWLVDGDFARRALQGILEFQFNAITGIRELLPVDDIGTLDGLAEALFTV